MTTARKVSMLMVVVGLVVLAGAAPASAGHWKNCGDQKGSGAGFYDVQAKNVGCKKAKTVARKWTWGGGWQTNRFWGFNCKKRRIGYESSRVRCTRVLGSGRHQDVKFVAGA